MHCRGPPFNYRTEKRNKTMFSRKYKLHPQISKISDYYFIQTATNRINKKKVNVKHTYHQRFKNLLDIAILKKLNQCPQVSHLLDYYFVSPQKIVIITKHFQSTTIYDYLQCNKTFSEHQTNKIVYQILQAIQYCLKNKIFYKNIHEKNILINKRNLQIKLCNFYFATKLQNQLYYTKKLKINQSQKPPEYIVKQHYTVDSLTAWMLGRLLYKMLFLENPFQTLLQSVYFPCFLRSKPEISLTLKVFLNWCFEKNINDRIKINEMLHHPWITHCWI